MKHTDYALIPEAMLYMQAQKLPRMILRPLIDLGEKRFSTKEELDNFVYWRDQVAALLCFRFAVWKTAPRDQFIGWNDEQRKKNLHLVVNNARFLILPWVNAPNLASRILSMTQKRIAQDWMHCYQYAPVFIETFVETPRFQGSCYKAANWTCLGTTKGVGRLGNSHKPTLPKKSIWVYPLKKKVPANSLLRCSVALPSGAARSF